MARTFLKCWIVNDQSITNTVLATGITIDTGEKALKIVPVSGANTSVSFGAPTGVNNWRRMRIKFTAFPTTNARAIAGIVSSGGPNIRINPSGKLDWYIFNTLNDSGTTVLSLNTVYTIEFRSSNVAGSHVTRQASVSLMLPSSHVSTPVYTNPSPHEAARHVPRHASGAMRSPARGPPRKCRWQPRSGCWRASG